MVRHVIAATVASLIACIPLAAEAKDPWKEQEKEQKEFYKHQRKSAHELEKYQRKQLNRWEHQERDYYRRGW